MTQTHRYFIINKPANMVSQFLSSHQVNLLGNLDFPFPEGTHAIGRLDNHSEGLLLLTTNKKVTRLLFQGEKKHKRVYLVQVNNSLSEENLEKLRTGVDIRIKGGSVYTTPPCDAAMVADPKLIYNDVNDLQQYGSNSWILITLTEGKFRQVRKMIAAIRHRCKRLIRVSIEGISLNGMQPRQVIETDEHSFFERLGIVNEKPPSL